MKNDIKEEITLRSSQIFSTHINSGEVLDKEGFMEEIMELFTQSLSQQRKEIKEELINLMDGVVFDGKSKNSEQFKEFLELYNDLKKEDKYYRKEVK